MFTLKELLLGYSQILFSETGDICAVVRTSIEDDVSLIDCCDFDGRLPEVAAELVKFIKTNIPGKIILTGVSDKRLEAKTTRLDTDEGDRVVKTEPVWDVFSELGFHAAPRTPEGEVLYDRLFVALASSFKAKLLEMETPAEIEFEYRKEMAWKSGSSAFAGAGSGSSSSPSLPEEFHARSGVMGFYSARKVVSRELMGVMTCGPLVHLINFKPESSNDGLFVGMCRALLETLRVKIDSGEIQCVVTEHGLGKPKLGFRDVVRFECQSKIVSFALRGGSCEKRYEFYCA